MQWKRVHLWHMLVHAIASVLVLVTTARVLELQMEDKLQTIHKIQLRKLKVKVLYCYLLRT